METNSNIRVGDSVNYYNFTNCRVETGIVTAIDVEVGYLFQWEDKSGMHMCDIPPAAIGSSAKAMHPMGVEINNGIRRAYQLGTKSKIID